MKASTVSVFALVVGALLAVAFPAFADRNDSSTDNHGSRHFSIPLISHQEVPAVSSAAIGSFRATINRERTTIAYELSYDQLAGDVRQAHIHFGQKGVNGGISVFLCQTTTNVDPTGFAPTCPPPPARVTGTLTSANIVGPAAQGIAATEFSELIDAINAGVAYANVHSSTFAGGEVRGQIPARGHDGWSDD